MEREELMEKTMHKLGKLPTGRVMEVSDFVTFISQRTDDAILTEGIEQLVSNGKAFDFLHDEPDIYTVNDLKVRYR